jgi:sterol desaturase/sphingolipid hydroxylase (fatty acid hydroxylase superfamily)
MEFPDYDLTAIIGGWVRALEGTLTDPISPFWWPSLLLAGLAGLVIARLAGIRFVEVHRQVSPDQRRAYLRELPVDLACWVASTALPFFLGPLLMMISWIGILLAAVLLQPVFGPIDAQAPAPGAAVLVAAAAAAFVCGDFMLYWTHRWFHRVPFLWRMHRLHHAPPVLTPLTAFRFWPQEHVVHLCGNMLGQGVGLGVVMSIAGTQVAAFTVLGVNVVMLVWGMAFAHLRHSPIPMGFPGWVSRILVSPHMHQAHHSSDSRHHDRNFGTALAVWDGLFGTRYVPAKEERFRFGLLAGAGPAASPPPAPPAASLSATTMAALSWPNMSGRRPGSGEPRRPAPASGSPARTASSSKSPEG